MFNYDAETIHDGIADLIQVQNQQNKILEAISKHLAEISKCLMAEAKKGETTK